MRGHRLSRGGADVAQTVSYLRAREQVNGVYRETHVPVALIEGPRREVLALTYIVERAHPSYAGRLRSRCRPGSSAAAAASPATTSTI